MIASLPPLHATSYATCRLVDELNEPTALLAVRRQRMNDAPWEDVAISRLGNHGWGRLLHFRQYYRRGWGNHRTQPLSPRAFEATIQFLSDGMPPSNDKKPSVFLTDRGGLELCWETSSGKAVQVEFTRDRVEYFNEATGAEGELPLSDFKQLKQILSI
ncbi:MAG: hypothetical protein HS122_04660 [Opitutaceae bacterium]|nr:hypothetical protein [Opitutaceae bacterium]